jgi:hypothetical protein
MPNVQGFIQQYAPVAASVSQRIGVAPDVLLGQWGLETGWGKSVVPGTNNLGNIKGPGVAATDNQTGSNDQYRAYSSPQAFGNDFANLISSNYKGAIGAGSDASAYGKALKAGGYATDSGYANKLSSAVGMVRKFGDAIASAISGSANAAELSPQQMSGAPVISATGQQIMPQATKQPAAAPTSAPPASTGDPLLDMANAVQSGSAASSSTPAAPTASAQPAQAADDPLLAMANSVMSAKDTAPAATVQPTTAQQTVNGKPWQPPGAVTMGIGDAIKGGVQSLAHGGAWLANKIAPDAQFTKDLNAAVPQIDQTIQSQDAQYAAQRAANGGTGIDIGRGVGNAIGAVPLAAAMPAGSGVIGGIGAGALSGAANSLIEPVTDVSKGYANQKLQQAGTGAIVGGVANPLMRAIGAAVSPTVGAAQQKLLDAGVPLTPGQILGGAAARTEAKLTSVPFVGDMIKNGQQRAVQGFNKATYNEVLAPLGQTYDGPIGNEGVAAVQKTISNAYDDALSKLTFKADPQFQSDLGNLASMAQNLPPAQQGQFMSVVKNQIVGKLSPQGEMDGATLKGVQSELGRISRGLTGDPSFDNQQLGQAIGEVKNLVEQSLPRNNASDAVQDLANANSAYANFVRLRAAAGSQGAMNNEGVFTAAQLNNAVRGADKSAGKGATATGNALMQDFSSAGQSVLGSKYPDSGTPGRALLALMGPAALGQAFVPGYTAPLAAAMGVGALPYTAMGQKAAQALLTARPGFAVPVGNALSRYGVPLAAPAGNALINAITRPQ